MFINLKSAAKLKPQTVSIELQTRLPAQIAPCTVHCQFKVEELDDYFILKLEIDADLSVTCQRCLNEFSYHYSNRTELAICNSESLAEKVMEHYESLVSLDYQVDLKELLTDELHLYGPEFHQEISDCESEVSKYISADNAIKS